MTKSLESVCASILRSTYDGFSRNWTILWSSKVMLGHVDVTDDVVVGLSVLAWTEVPRLLFGVIGPILESLHLVLEIQNVVGLFVSQSAILKTEGRVLMHG